jgi:urease alpha subunit
VIGKAGHPEIQPGVNIIIGPGTDISSRIVRQAPHRGRRRQPRSIFICPQQIDLRPF